MSEQPRPSWQTGSLVPSPPGVAWSFVPSGWRDAARPDIPAGNLLGGVGYAAMSEPTLMVPTDSGLFVLPQPNDLPDLAAVIRNILLGR